MENEEHRSKYYRTIRSTISILIVVASVAILLASIFFPVFRIYGSSMSPTVKEGEIVVSLKGSSFSTGDIVVLSFNNKLLVKRMIATPGQWVDIDADGNVYIDNELIDEPYIKQKALGDCTITLPYQVPEGKYFVMGDNRPTSQDSRSELMGCIPKEQIIGRAIIKVWPLSEFGKVDSK